MNLIEISNTKIFLKGISLKGHLSIINCHQDLVVSYYIQNKFQKFLKVFPQSGVILRKQSTTIRFKYKINEAILEDPWIIKIICSYDNQYNKIKLDSNFIKQRQIQNWQQQFQIQICLSNQYENIKSSIRQSLLLQNSFKKDRFQISAIMSIPNQPQKSLEEIKFQEEQNVNKNQQKIKSNINNNNQQGELPIQSLQHLQDEQNQEESHPLLISLDTSPSNHYQFGKNRKSGEINRKITQYANKQLVMSQIAPQNHNHIANNKIISVDNLQLGEEIILLAIIAGFFLALGANISLFFH